MKKILILEDNPVTIEHIASLIQEIAIENKVFACSDRKEAYQYALETDIDLFIIDIILDTSRPGDSSGLKFVDSIRKIERYVFTPVIFVTSLEDAKLYTYQKLHCYSFIEKPFEPDMLKELVKQCLRFPSAEQKKKTLYFRKDGIILAADREDIVYVDCVNHILDIHTIQGDLLSIPYVTLKKFLADADNDDFIQCSRSSVVNRCYIHNVDITNRAIQLKNQMGTVEIGIMYKKRLKEIFK
uniref:LytR/AlgR family response regulator transcription factor n=1 Tax=Agathobacter sp. TaxID=2021311 RepID=UPI0040563A8C